MTTFYLVRHADIEPVGKWIAGRTPGVHLSEQGRHQLRALARLAATLNLTAVYTSPLARAQETALALADPLGGEYRIAEELLEVDFGDWTGYSFETLEPLIPWQNFNTFRSGSRIPRGEMMIDVQQRVVGFMQQLRADFPEDNLLLVSHGDALRSALLYWLGMPIDFIARLQWDPAGVTALQLDERQALLRYHNLNPELIRF